MKFRRTRARAVLILALCAMLADTAMAAGAEQALPATASKHADIVADTTWTADAPALAKPALPPAAKAAAPAAEAADLPALSTPAAPAAEAADLPALSTPAAPAAKPADLPALLKPAAPAAKPADLPALLKPAAPAAKPADLPALLKPAGAAAKAAEKPDAVTGGSAARAPRTAPGKIPAPAPEPDKVPVETVEPSSARRLLHRKLPVPRGSTTHKIRRTDLPMPATHRVPELAKERQTLPSRKRLNAKQIKRILRSTEDKW